MKCSKCDTELTKDDAFCPECGKKVGKTIEKKFNFKLIGIIIGVVIILAVMIFSFPHIFKKPSDVIEAENKDLLLDKDEGKLTEEASEIVVPDKEGSCEDECSSDTCSGFDYTECLMQSDGCKDKKTRGKIKGKCDVECTTSNDCDSDEECKSYKCVIKEDDNICNKPLIKSGTACCVDLNDNKICDKVEGILDEGSHIELNFVQGNPPTEVTDGGTFSFDVVVHLKNKNFNLENVIITLVGFLPEDFGKSDSDLVTNVGTLKPYETKTFRFSNLNFVGDLAGNTAFIIRAEVVYEYLGRFYEESIDAEMLVKHLLG